MQQASSQEMRKIGFGCNVQGSDFAVESQHELEWPIGGAPSYLGLIECYSPSHVSHFKFC